MTSARLRQALAYAARGWPVFPCQVGQKTPATAHGHLDATTDPEQITAWFTRNPPWNLAIATGAPGPDVLDVDDHGPAGNGYPAFRRLNDAGLLQEPVGPAADRRRRGQHVAALGAEVQVACGQVAAVLGRAGEVCVQAAAGGAHVDGGAV